MPIELRPGMILGIDPTTGDLCELPATREPEALSVVEAAEAVLKAWFNPSNFLDPLDKSLDEAICELQAALKRAKP